MSGAARLIKAEIVTSGEDQATALTPEKIQAKAKAAPAEAPKGKNATSTE